MRELLIYGVSQFIENFNASKKLLSYVKTPYDIKNFEINIFLDDNKGNDLDPKAFSVGEITNNCLIYSSMDMKNYKIEKLYEETYQEALEKVKSPKASASESLK